MRPQNTGTKQDICQKYAHYLCDIRFDNSYFKEDLEEASSIKAETAGSKNTTVRDKSEDIFSDTPHIDKKMKVEHEVDR